MNNGKVCELFKNKECVGKNWCGICPLYEYENSNYRHIPTNVEEFAMMAQRELFKECQKYKDNFDKFVGYYSAIQILERLLHDK